MECGHVHVRTLSLISKLCLSEPKSWAYLPCHCFFQKCGKKKKEANVPKFEASYEKERDPTIHWRRRSQVSSNLCICLREDGASDLTNVHLSSFTSRAFIEFSSQEKDYPEFTSDQQTNRHSVIIEACIYTDVRVRVSACMQKETYFSLHYLKTFKLTFTIHHRLLTALLSITSY